MMQRVGVETAAMGVSVVTGANRGIGLELCKLLAGRGAEVVAVCRKPSEALEGLGVQVIEGIDVADDAVGAKLAAQIQAPVDLLVNNAGILLRETLQEMSFDGIRAQLEVNSLGPLRVTTGLLERLHEGSKVAIVTSRMGSIADNTSGSRYGYRMSKAAVNAAGKSLAHDLAPKKVAVALLHPGFVATEMTGGSGNVPPEEAAADLLQRIDELTLETTGRFLHAKGQELPW